MDTEGGARETGVGGGALWVLGEGVRAEGPLVPLGVVEEPVGATRVAAGPAASEMGFRGREGETWEMGVWVAGRAG